MSTSELDSATRTPGPGSPYWTFYAEVAAAQLAAWLPPDPIRVLDLSVGCPRFAELLVAGGHDVVHVVSGAGGVCDTTGPGRLRPVMADVSALTWLADGSVDGVLAE